MRAWIIKMLKQTFGAKARMLSSDEVVTVTGHPVGGVCPFGLEKPAGGLLRYFAQAVCRSPACCWCHSQRGAHFTGTHGRANQSHLGGRLPVTPAPDVTLAQTGYYASGMERREEVQRAVVGYGKHVRISAASSNPHRSAHRASSWH